MVTDFVNLDNVALESFSAEKIAEEQKSSNDVKNHLNKKLPRGVVMGHSTFGDVELFCELSGPKPRPLLPESLRGPVMEIFHGLDHCGQKPLLHRCAAEYYWPKQSKNVSKFVKECHPCQAAKTGKQIHLPISQIPVPARRFSHINLDILGPLPESNGFKYMLIAMA